jgi:hypothetical protein
MNDDRQLMRQYAETGSEEAFGEVVSRHVDLVYSVAFAPAKRHRSEAGRRHRVLIL